MKTNLIQRSMHHTQAVLLCCLLLFVFPGCSGSAGGVNVWDAAKSENLADLDKFAKAGGDVNCQAWDGVTPLLYCLLNKKRKSYERLIKLGADSNIISSNGRVVIKYAAREKDTFWLKLALEHKGNPNLAAHDKSRLRQASVFRFAISQGNFENIKLLVKHGLTLNQPNERGQTPLAVAAMFAEFEVVYYLLEAGSDYSIPTPEDCRSFLDLMQDRRLSMFPDPDVKKWLNKVLDWLEAEGDEVNAERLRIKEKAKKKAQHIKTENK